MPDMSQANLNGRVILITGASGGLGTALAPAAARAGAELILTGRRLKPLEAVYDTVISTGGPQPALFPIDFTKAGADDYQRLIDGITADCGRLDGIVHLAASFDGLKPLHDYDIAQWQRSLHVNLTAPFALTQACMPLLRAAPDASVVFVRDESAHQAKAYWGAYAAAKVGADTLYKMLAAEYRHVDKLRFNAVSPGPLNIGLRKKAFPADEPGARAPDAAVNAILYLLGPQGRASRGACLDCAEFG